MQWSQPPAPPAYPPLPPDDRIKKAVRRGQVFNDPYDAARAVAYAEGFLKNGNDLIKAPILLGILVGLLLTAGLQLAVGNWFLLIVPFGAAIGLLVYVVWFSLNKPRVQQALDANRRVAGG